MKGFPQVAAAAGRCPPFGDQIHGTYSDAAAHVAKGIETNAKFAQTRLSHPVSTRFCIASNTDTTARLMLDIAHQDTNIARQNRPAPKK